MREIERAIADVKRSDADWWMRYMFQGNSAMARVYWQRMKRRKEVEEWETVV